MAAYSAVRTAALFLWAPLVLLQVAAAGGKDAPKYAFQIHNDGSFGSVESTFQAVRSMEVAMKGAVPPLPRTCKWLESSKAVESNVSAAYFAVRTASILRCQGAQKLALEAEPIFLSSAKASTDLLPLYYSILGIAFLKDTEWAIMQSAEPLTDAFSKLKALHKTGGPWKYSTADSTATAKAAGLGLEAVAALVKLGAPYDQTKLDSIKKSIPKLFKTEVNADGTQSLLLGDPADVISGGAGPVPSTSAAIKGAISLAAELKEPLEVKEEVIALAESLLQLGQATSLVDSFYSIDVGGILNDNPVVVPVLVTPETTTISADRPFVVKVATILGDKVPGAKVEIEGVGAGKQVLEKVNATTFKLKDIPGAAAGSLHLGIDVTTTDPKYAARKPLTKKVQVKKSIKVEAAKLQVFDAEDSSPEVDLSLTVGKPHPQTISASHLQRLRLTFKLLTSDGAAYHPQQVFCTLTHEETGVDHLFVVPHSKDKYTLDLDLLKLMAKFFHLSGPYLIEVSVGDARLENSFVWSVATADLDLPEAPESAPKPPARKASLEELFSPRAEIQHLFRVPEKRPPLAVSYAFVALLFVPFLLFLLGLKYLGVNFSAFPTSGAPAVAAALFHAGIAAILILYVAFWVEVNLLTTLKVLVVLALLTAIPGHYTLAHLADFSAKLKTA